MSSRIWSFTADMNFDGLVTISDIGLWVNWIFTYPGDWVILKLSHNSIGRFFEFSTADYGGFLSFWISIFVFIALPFMASAFLVGREEFNENASPEEKLKDRKFWSIVQFTIFSAFFLYISVIVGEAWVVVMFALMFTTGLILLFTLRRWNR